MNLVSFFLYTIPKVLKSSYAFAYPNQSFYLDIYKFKEAKPFFTYSALSFNAL